MSLPNSIFKFVFTTAYAFAVFSTVASLDKTKEDYQTIETRLREASPKMRRHMEMVGPESIESVAAQVYFACFVTQAAGHSLELKGKTIRTDEGVEVPIEKGFLERCVVGLARDTYIEQMLKNPEVQKDPVLVQKTYNTANENYNKLFELGGVDEYLDATLDSYIYFFKEVDTFWQPDLFENN